MVFSSMAAAQSRPMVTEAVKRPMSVAARNNLYCAGYIQSNAISTANKIIGANDEADRYNFKIGRAHV